MLSFRRGCIVSAVVAAPLTVMLAAGASAGTAPASRSLAGAAEASPRAEAVEARVKNLVTVGAHQFKDLNANGTVDPYEDWHRSSTVRAADLVSRMTLEEKAGLMHITSERRGAPPGTPVADPYAATIGYLQDRNIRYFVIRDNPTARDLADRANDYQELAEGSRLGIPVVFASNPRNHVNPDQ